MDGQSRELLTWALVKVAEPRVCDDALHVLPSNAVAADCFDRGMNFPSCPSLISLVKSFDSGLVVYEGFCNLKQVQHILAPEGSDPASSWLNCKYDIHKCDSSQKEILQGHI
ncbi:hypothetical protein Taro_024762 [Colocasia esculenta]|uniref:Uncharacterized protein n=1 Tax=Colocasia esculenta TaxID=4460 RepID=A0A843VC75_COLES|nr:hypothetical protein [Colocasia esculenta]